MKTIGCIGCGNMGGAILRGIAAAGLEYRLLGLDHTPDKIAACGAAPVTDAATLAAEADILFVAVKPYAVPAALHAALDEPLPSRRRIVVSVAAGMPLDALRAAVPAGVPLVRCMPNTPVAVGMGSFALCLDDPGLTDADKAELRALFGALGEVVEIPEDKFPAFTALVGCGPAYVFYMIEALSEAGVLMGFPRAMADRMAAYLCAGSAKLALAPDAHPALLREAVCSPAGYTIAGIAELDRHAVKSAVVSAVCAAWEKEKVHLAGKNK